MTLYKYDPRFEDHNFFLKLQNRFRIIFNELVDYQNERVSVQNKFWRGTLVPGIDDVKYTLKEFVTRMGAKRIVRLTRPYSITLFTKQEKRNKQRINFLEFIGDKSRRLSEKLNQIENNLSTYNRAILFLDEIIDEAIQAPKQNAKNTPVVFLRKFKKNLDQQIIHFLENSFLDNTQNSMADIANFLEFIETATSLLNGVAQEMLRSNAGDSNAWTGSRVDKFVGVMARRLQSNDFSLKHSRMVSTKVPVLKVGATTGTTPPRQPPQTPPQAAPAPAPGVAEIITTLRENGVAATTIQAILRERGIHISLRDAQGNY